MFGTDAKVVAIIGARAGSKRLPNKNKKELLGKPLICYTIDQALECEFIDEIILTTDDKEILEIVENKYNHYIQKIKLIERPSELAQDDTPSWKYIQHALKDYDQNTHVIILQPTSPLRTVEDIRMAYSVFQMGECKFGVVSAYWEYPMKELKLNGAIYINWLNSIVICRTFIFPATIFYLMPKERSVDIDTIRDWRYAENILRNRK